MTTWTKRTLTQPEGIPETGVVDSWVSADSVSSSWRLGQYLSEVWIGRYLPEVWIEEVFEATDAILGDDEIYITGDDGETITED